MKRQKIARHIGAIKRISAAVATAALTSAMMVGLSPVAHAATTPCADDEVTVIVDGFGAGCAPAGGNGYETLRAAGFDVEVTQKFPDFICRINGSPGPDVDQCLTASPADAYWSYWHAPLGASEWTYSNFGAFARSPEAGTVEAWMWGAGKAPGAVPVSKTQAANGEKSKPPSYNLDAAEGQGNFDIPMVDTSQWDFSGPDNGNNGGSNDAAAEDGAQDAPPEPEVNPDNPDEMIQYRDSEGNAISREEYEVIVEEAATAENGSGGSSNRSSGGTSRAGSNSRGAQPSESRERSTVVRTAPGTKRDSNSTQAAGDTDDELQLYTGQPTASAAESGGSSAWTIALAIAAIILVGAAAAAAWVVRRKEVSG